MIVQVSEACPTESEFGTRMLYKIPGVGEMWQVVEDGKIKRVWKPAK